MIRWICLYKFWWGSQYGWPWLETSQPQNFPLRGRFRISWVPIGHSQVSRMFTRFLLDLLGCWGGGNWGNPWNLVAVTWKKAFEGPGHVIYDQLRIKIMNHEVQEQTNFVLRWIIMFSNFWDEFVSTCWVISPNSTKTYPPYPQKGAIFESSYWPFLDNFKSTPLIVCLLSLHLRICWLCWRCWLCWLCWLRRRRLKPSDFWGIHTPNLNLKGLNFIGEASNLFSWEQAEEALSKWCDAT